MPAWRTPRTTREPGGFRPIAGDARYGGALVIGGHPVPRLMLHAAALRFPHPSGGEKRLEAPTPADMTGLIAALGLAG